jgi:hypothetical protein
MSQQAQANVVSTRMAEDVEEITVQFYGMKKMLK